MQINQPPENTFKIASFSRLLMILEVIKKMNGENIAVRAYKLIIDLYKNYGIVINMLSDFLNLKKHICLFSALTKDVLEVSL